MSTFFSSPIPVIAFHRVLPYKNSVSVTIDEFDHYLQWLKRKGFRSLSSTEFERALAGEQIVERGLVITFDDGYRDNCYVAAPILKKYGMKALLFVITGQVKDEQTRQPTDTWFEEGDERYLSWEEIRSMVEAEFSSFIPIRTLTTRPGLTVLPQISGRSCNRISLHRFKPCVTKAISMRFTLPGLGATFARSGLTTWRCWESGFHIPCGRAPIIPVAIPGRLCASVARSLRIISNAYARRVPRQYLEGHSTVHQEHGLSCAADHSFCIDYTELSL